MSKHLFCFGYCTPHQWTDNEAHGWDDESSNAFFVVSDSEEAALARGKEVVELAVARFVRLGVRSGWR